MAETPSLAEFTGNCADLDREAYTLRVHVPSKQKLKAGWADYATRMLSVRRVICSAVKMWVPFGVPIDHTIP